MSVVVELPKSYDIIKTSTHIVVYKRSEPNKRLVIDLTRDRYFMQKATRTLKKVVKILYGSQETSIQATLDVYAN